MRNNQVHSKKELGSGAGAVVGLAIGLVTAVAMSLAGTGLTMAVGALIAFVLFFAAYGFLMGTLFDVDARQRGVVQAGKPKPRRPRHIKTQPLPLPNIQ